MVNCPNCGAPMEPYKCRCEYCGTYYFDFTAFDMSGDHPYYVKFRTPYGVLTTLAKPEAQTIEVKVDSRDITDLSGNIVKRFIVNKTCDLDVVFHSVINPENNTLFTVGVENEQKIYRRND